MGNVDSGLCGYWFIWLEDFGRVVDYGLELECVRGLVDSVVDEGNWNWDRLCIVVGIGWMNGNW